MEANVPHKARKNHRNFLKTTRLIEIRIMGKNRKKKKSGKTANCKEFKKR
jgi:hypothetical protein